MSARTVVVDETKSRKNYVNNRLTVLMKNFLEHETHIDVDKNSFISKRP